MKITGHNILKSLEFAQASDINERLQRNKNQKEVDNVSSGDNVNLSPGAVEFRKIKNAVNAVPEIREDKLKTISDQLLSGGYKVSAEHIASKLISENIINTLLED